MPLNFPNSPVSNQLYTAYGKTWRWNGEGWESYTFTVIGASGASGGAALVGTENEIEITASGNTYTIGLPDNVTVTDTLTAQYFNVNGNTFSGSPSGVTLSSTLGVVGDINITGKLLVDGVIVSKTGFSGFTLDGTVEPITDVSLDGGEF
jgi:hypothetical protein